MKIIDELLLATFRSPGRCEYCGKYCIAREGHHLWGRGLGGGTRLDIPINLIALGSSHLFQCQCHNLAHAGKLTRADFLPIVARREQTTPEAIEEEIYRLRRLP